MISSILGVDHVGLGVRDRARMSSFYRDALGFGKVLAEMPHEDHPAIHGLLRAEKAVHSAMVVGSEAGGLTVALFHATTPAPRPIRRDPRYGDIGVAKLTFAVPDLDSFCRERDGLAGLFSAPKTADLSGSGEYHFVYGRDPEGNLLEFVAGSTPAEAAAPGSGAASAGGLIIRSVGVAITDLERSFAFYRDVLGFDTVIEAPHESFSGLVDELTGTERTTVHSCFLANSKGRGMIELFEVAKPRGRSIPFGTQWGDFGYLQLCLYATDQETLIAQIEAEDVDVLLPLQDVGDPEHPALFMYLRDPDGIPVEVVVGTLA
jgi:catechol 2,3-dioxygenase-like lactoylglutathione lyase family enzyme